jgi:hypothetical protein
MGPGFPLHSTGLRRYLAHLPFALAFVWTFPLVSHLASALPGRPGDNFAFLWNFWWIAPSFGEGKPD